MTMKGGVSVTAGSWFGRVAPPPPPRQPSLEAYLEKVAAESMTAQKGWVGSSESSVPTKTTTKKRKKRRRKRVNVTSNTK